MTAFEKEIPRSGMAARLERRLAPAMTLSALLFLGVLAGMLPQTPAEDELADWHVAQWFLVPLGAIWSLFIAEFVIVAILYGPRRSWKRLAFALAAAVAPPLRPCLRSPGRTHNVYIPFLGWQTAGSDLARDLERRLGTPMMIVALMILPILGLELLWTHALSHHLVLVATIEIGTRLIWLAFAIEFFIMIAATDSKLGYCRTHWIDLVIIVLPLVAFLRILRLARIGRLARLQQMSRMYRLRSIFYRILRATLLLEIVFRLDDRLAKARLTQLKNRLQWLQEESDAVRQQIADLEEDLARRALEEKAAAFNEEG